MIITRAKIITTAHAWLGTPYHHQARTKQVGTDCLGLILGVFHELYGYTPETPPNYSSDWAEASHTETMLEGARKHLSEKSRQQAEPGDILIFRLRKNTIAKHAAILSASNKMIHAIENVPVSEVHLNGWWRRRTAAVFEFPGVQN